MGEATLSKELRKYLRRLARGQSLSATAGDEFFARGWISSTGAITERGRAAIVTFSPQAHSPQDDTLKGIDP